MTDQASVAEFFENTYGTSSGPDRTRHKGEPLLVPRYITEGDVGPFDDSPRARYTRASYLAEYVSDNTHIVRWEKRLLAKSMGMNPDLAAWAASETYTTGLRRPPKGTVEYRANADSGRRLDDVVERALDRMGVHERADYGTAIHRWTEADNREPVPQIHNAPEDVAALEDAFARHHMRRVGSEIFVANDEVMAAGTFDHLIHVPGFGWCVGDTKTGDAHAHEFAVQLSVYSHGEIYDLDTHRRTPLESLTGGEPINRQVGWLFQVKDGVCKVLILDLERGFEGAQVAARARDYSELTGIMADGTDELVRGLRTAREELMTSIKGTSDYETLERLHRNHKDIWTDAHTAAAKTRLS